MNYYLIRCDANGISIQELTKERLEKELQKGILDADGKPLDFIPLLVDDSNRWQYRSLSDDGGNLIIKGDMRDRNCHLTLQLRILETDPFPGKGGDKELLNSLKHKDVYRLHISRTYTAFYRKELSPILSCISHFTILKIYKPGTSM